MKHLAWTHIDRTEWGDGPWHAEPDKEQWTDPKTGLPCLLKRNPLGGHLCGYVGVSPGHPLHATVWVDLEDDMDVHGGLTFAEGCAEGPVEKTICHVPDPGEPDNVWWLGFDCAHAGDFSPGHHDLKSDVRILLQRDETYRDVAFVKAECAKLALALQALGTAA